MNQALGVYPLVFVYTTLVICLGVATVFFDNLRCVVE